MSTKFYVFMTIWLGFLGWMTGAVLAPGSLKVLAICWPFYAWYVTVERMLQLNGWI